MDDVDCIANAAHGSLMGGGGVDGAIHRAAGPALLRECRAIPTKKDDPGTRCLPGEAYLTGACNLPCKWVVHTVAPIFVGSVSGKWPEVQTLMQALYKNAKPGSEKELAECYKNCIRVARAQGIRRIAFPSLGTGGHAWPVEVAAPVAMKAIKEALEECPGMTLVRMACFAPDDLVLYQEAINAAWPPDAGG